MSVPSRLKGKDNSKESSSQKRQKVVAVRYQPEFDPAPKIVAGGEGEIAKRIIELATQHNVPIYEQPDVVEALAKFRGTQAGFRYGEGMHIIRKVS